MSDLSGPDNNQKVVRLLGCWQPVLEEDLVLSLPNARLGAFKNTVNHRQRIIRIESSDSVEPDMTDDLWPRPNLSVDGNPGRVEVGRPRKPPRIVLVFPKTPTPNAPEICDCNQHLFHAPFNRLFFCRSAYNSSCSRLIWPTNLAPSPLGPVDTGSPAPLPLSRCPFTFFDNASSRVERSPTISDFCLSSS